MTHIPAHHPDIAAVHGAPPALPEPIPLAHPVPTRKRKANIEDDAEPSNPEPTRLKRSHGPCARCRSKKIKCDSMHPRCTACQNAGTGCHQEDQHHQTLIRRGDTEAIEHKLAQSELLLKRQFPDFSLDELDTVTQGEVARATSP
ncbi:hypothetical protein M422DRAFT_36634 [Sphaerobolus stellatus SS14]|uniref:Zn(2)-C6 fungal-type domain-containing protein n=1 Tax=Sphaerobolus stellatus (strain SS14) TaxID=990650 RepID=A0A0C9TKH1_SPHS4|nr:hypothetical protein M422DRAFT_36634 [Sphaerobolus stellatus SS14]